MRFLTFALDLAAVLNASRSVAAKHVALRGRQLDTFTRTSSLTPSLRVQRANETKIPPHTERSGTAERDAAVSASREESPAVKCEPASRVDHDTSRPGSSLPTNNRGQTEGLQSDSATILSQLRTASGPKLSSVALSEHGQGKDPVPTGVTDTPSTPGIEIKEEDVPSGVNVNIFHTKKGSNMLGDLGKREKPKPVGLPEFVTHSHSKPSNTVRAASEHTEKAPESDVSAEIFDASPTSETEQTKPTPVIHDDSPATHPVEVNVANGEATTAAPAAEAPVKAHLLRESRVPSTRMGRIWNYGGLAAGMMGGAITESIGRAFGGNGQGSVMLSAANMERLVSKLSQMRGAALKFGQMMSFQDSKMLPGPIQEVLQRVQDRADYMPSWQRDKVLTANLGPEWRDLFGEFEEKPIAAASIGQVHRATLKEGGRRVAVKIQFPGVADSINSDLDNLGMLLTATKLLPRGLYLNKTIDNARLELGWECDYVREAKCAERYHELLADEADTFLVPRVHPQASGSHVLTMDFMDGVGVTRVKSFTQEQKDWIGTQILRLCLREITEFHFMQTDPNWTNFLYNAETNRLELLDFGASREFPDEFVAQYVQLLAAASRSDRETVRELSRGLGYLTGHESKVMVNAHIDSVLTLAEPFLESAPEVYDFQDQTITERVKALIPVMLSERLAPPPEETYSLHRKLSGAFLLCARLGSRVRCREMFQESLKKGGYV